LILRIGIDLGGTKTEIGVLSPDGGFLLRERVPTPRSSYEGMVQTIRDLVLGAEQRLGAQGSVGIAIPGAISPATGLVKNANSTALIGHPFDQDMEAALGRPVRVANDANCFALSEAVDGAGQGKHCVFGVIAGTGLGGGIAIDGRVHVGLQAIGGEWGHNPLPRPHPEEMPGPACYCGRLGCAEAFLSGRGLSDDHLRVTGRKLSAEDIAAQAEGGDETAAATMDRYYDRLARALSSIINVLDPDAVVFGGGLSQIEGIYREIPRRLQAYVFSDTCITPILKNRHGDSSGVRGAAWLWKNKN